VGKGTQRSNGWVAESESPARFFHLPVYTVEGSIPSPLK